MAADPRSWSFNFGHGNGSFKAGIERRLTGDETHWVVMKTALSGNLFSTLIGEILEEPRFDGRLFSTLVSPEVQFGRSLALGLFATIFGQNT